jgi:outer membrane protein TolC
MKQRIWLLLLIIFQVPVLSYSQKAITLRDCYDMAAKRSSLAGEKESYSSIWQLRDENLSKSWLPALDANGSIVYNSEVVNLKEQFAGLPIPGVPLMPHDQYKITIDINQMIYDGGAIKKARAVEQADLRVNQQMTEADLYKLKSQINSCYFSILLIGRQKELLSNYLELILKRIKSMQSGVENGMFLKSDIDVMTSEKIKIEQQLAEAEIKRLSLIAVLSDLTGESITEGSTFILPLITDGPDTVLLRPEIKVFDLRKEQLEAGLEVIQTKRMPKAFGFATLGYGNPPGSNFFRAEFAPYYIVGAGVKWNIWDWSRVKNEKQQVKLQQVILENRKSDLTDNLRRSLDLKESEIKSYENAINRDEELVTLRKRITASAESQYENGSITATELLNEMNSQKQAEISSEIHKINYEMTKVEYLNISGKEIK